jgi:dsDNA-binding SOS-regulon protein
MTNPDHPTADAQLLPCPGCNAKSAILVRDGTVFKGQNYYDRYPDGVATQSHGYRVECQLHCFMTCWWHYESEAIEAWNTRPSTGNAQQAELEKLLTADEVDTVLNLIESEQSPIIKKFLQRLIDNTQLLVLAVTSPNLLITRPSTGNAELVEKAKNSAFHMRLHTVVSPDAYLQAADLIEELGTALQQSSNQREGVSISREAAVEALELFIHNREEKFEDELRTALGDSPMESKDD